MPVLAITTLGSLFLHLRIVPFHIPPVVILPVVKLIPRTIQKVVRLLLVALCHHHGRVVCLFVVLIDQERYRSGVSPSRSFLLSCK